MGSKVANINIKDVTTDDIISMMIGRDLSNLFPKEEFNIGKEVLRVENITS